ncbi:acylphosphatase [Kaistia dalseonensis]|uniref:acylphosphatase n=1 Tax=Kaistia dalseonensis TaxID=410840 RepID=A0ABU0H3D0_9HYPH|nr:acylphosphatase [Kaistia dalseonensis]MCX5493460.1 acylphosphatase [Kaistia dalseonensis]MDQ0436019.1 acylphosphatase [Kaistia dalseonensis]
MKKRSVHIVVSGAVQGIGYRAWVERQAVARGLSGWVRNRRDGTVEAIFSGDQPAVDAMVATCWQGPQHATVANVAITEDIAVEDGVFTIAPSE